MDISLGGGSSALVWSGESRSGKIQRLVVFWKKKFGFLLTLDNCNFLTIWSSEKFLVSRNIYSSRSVDSRGFFLILLICIILYLICSIILYNVLWDICFCRLWRLRQFTCAASACDHLSVVDHAESELLNSSHKTKQPFSCLWVICVRNLSKKKWVFTTKTAAKRLKKWVIFQPLIHVFFN